jgi:hypothetical protein
MFMIFCPFTSPQLTTTSELHYNLQPTLSTVKIMCFLNAPCRLSPSECDRSFKRVVDGESFRGEDSHTYSDAKRYNGKDFDRSPLYHEPYRRELPAPNGDLLYQKVLKRWEAKPCTICHRVVTFFRKNDFRCSEVIVGRT